MLGRGGNPLSHRLGKVTYAIGATATPEQSCGAASPASSISISDSSAFHLFRGGKKTKTKNNPPKKKTSKLQTPPQRSVFKAGGTEQGGAAWNEAPSQGEVAHPPHPPPPPPPARRCGKGAAVGAPRPRGNFWNKQPSWREERNLYTRRGERGKKQTHVIKGRGLHEAGEK